MFASGDLREVVSQITRDPPSGAHHGGSSAIADTGEVVRSLVGCTACVMTGICGLSVADLSRRTDFTLRARGCGCLFVAGVSSSLTEVCCFFTITCTSSYCTNHTTLLRSLVSSTSSCSCYPTSPNSKVTPTTQYTRLVVGMRRPLLAFSCDVPICSAPQV